jgi:hypothetical protein
MASRALRFSTSLPCILEDVRENAGDRVHAEGDSDGGSVVDGHLTLPQGPAVLRASARSVELGFAAPAP